MHSKFKAYTKYKIYESNNKCDFSSQTIEDLTCYLCNYKWDNKYDLYSHIVTQCHKSKKYFTCLRCKFKLNEFSLEDHDCLRSKSLHIKHISCNSIKYGLPLICLLCHGRKFRSKVVLFVHLLCYHSPNVVKSNKCGICTFKIKRKIINKKLEQYCLPQYDKSFDKHIEENHVYGYDLSFIYQLNIDTEKRHPYSCIACSTILNGNDQFHAHVICQHTTQNEYDKEMNVCLICNIPYWSSDKFAMHVNNSHSFLYRQLAIQLAKEGCMTNHVDLDSICVYCWSYFEKRNQLHSHILMQHSYFTTSIQCGLCNMNFKVNAELIQTYKLLNEHNEFHFSQFESNDNLKNDIFKVPHTLDEKLCQTKNLTSHNLKKKLDI